MKKIAKVLASFAALAFVVAPAVPANAYSEGVAPQDGVITVSTEDDLKEAIADTSITKIILGGNIVSTGDLNIERDNVNIDGAGHSIIRQRDTAGWDTDKNGRGDYVMQFYRVSGSLSNIKLTGGAGALLINGANVTLSGNIDVSGNEFGGIEVSTTDSSMLPEVNFDDAILVDTTESSSAPVMWLDKLTPEQVTVKYNGIQAAADYVDVNNDKNQVVFYLDAKNLDTTNPVYTPLAVDQFHVESSTDPETPDTETPDVTEPTTPVADEENKDNDNEATDVTAPNTGTTIANFALVLTGITVAVLTAVYATRFASAKK